MGAVPCWFAGCVFVCMDGMPAGCTPWSVLWSTFDGAGNYARLCTWWEQRYVAGAVRVSAVVCVWVVLSGVLRLGCTCLSVRCLPMVFGEATALVHGV